MQQHHGTETHKLYDQMLRKQLLRKEACGEKVCRLAWFVIINNLSETLFSELITLLAVYLDLGDWRHGRDQITKYLQIFYSLHKESVINIIKIPGAKLSNAVFLDLTLDKVSKSNVSSEIFLFGLINGGERKAILADMVQREYDADNPVIGQDKVAEYLFSIFQDYEIELTDVNGDLNSIDKWTVFTHICSDYVYLNGHLLDKVKEVFNTQGKLLITGLVDHLWDFEHRLNLAIIDTKDECRQYSIFIEKLMFLIQHFRTDKWQSFMKNVEKTFGTKDFLYLKRFIITRFGTHQLAVYYPLIRDFILLFFCAQHRDSTETMTILQSVMFVVLLVALFDIFLSIISPLSLQN